LRFLEVRSSRDVAPTRFLSRTFAPFAGNPSFPAFRGQPHRSRSGRSDTGQRLTDHFRQRFDGNRLRPHHHPGLFQPPAVSRAGEVALMKITGRSGQIAFAAEITSVPDIPRIRKSTGNSA